jgi:hypothetical protein
MVNKNRIKGGMNNLRIEYNKYRRNGEWSRQWWIDRNRI